MQRWSFVTLVLLSSCSSKPQDVTVDDLGVTLTVPGNWSVKKRGESEVAIMSGMDGVILRRERTPAATLAEAREALVQGAKIREEKQLPSGGFLFDYDTNFGTPEKPMMLRTVTSVLRTPTGTVSCQLQLQADQDAAPIVAACASMRPK